MPDLDQIFVGRGLGKSIDLQILEGKLTKRNGKFWARIDDEAQLMGPVIGGSDELVGKEIVIGVTQKSRPFVLYPQGT